MAETTIMVTIVIIEITEIKVETNTQLVITGLHVDNFTMSMTEDTFPKVNAIKKCPK